MHRYGLTEASNTFCELTSRLVHNDLHSNNIIINKENNQPIIIDIENGFYFSLEQPRLITADIDIFIIQALPTIPLMLSQPNIEHVLNKIYVYILNFVESYSTELSQADSIDFRQQINTYVVKVLKKIYELLIDASTQDKSFENKNKLASQEEFNQRIFVLSKLLMKDTKA